jgi:predicted secreted protein
MISLFMRKFIMNKIAICGIAAALIFGLFEIGVGAGSNPKKMMDDKSIPGLISLTIADSSRTIKVVVGDTLDLVLEGIPGTGYQWQFDSIDGAKLTPTELPRPLVPQRPYKVGGPRPYYFAFIAAVRGEAFIRLVYKRLWEKDIPPAITFELKINIESQHFGNTPAGR